MRGFLASGDRTTDYQVIRPRANGFCWGRYAGLVIHRRARWTHTRNDNQEFRPAGAADVVRLVRGRYHTIESRLFCKSRQCQRTSPRSSGDANLPE